MLNFTQYSLLSENLKYHLTNNIPLTECVFRYGSEAHFAVINEARVNKDNLELLPEEISLLETDIGTFGEFEGEHVPLDLPLIEDSILEEEMYKGKNVKLNSPKRGGKKKFYVYVKDPKTKRVKKITFGDTSGLSVKISNPKARKSFVARHKCNTRNDRTKPSYWSCRIPSYARMLGISGGGSFFW